jgi:TonB family protein
MTKPVPVSFAHLLALALVLVAAGSAAQEATVHKSGNGVSLPRVIRQVQPHYTQEAMRQMIEGEVLLDVVVSSNGSVGDVEVKESLDAVYGLDQEAVKAMKQWRFEPGTKDGKPVAVRVDVKMRFTLR